MYTTTKQRDKKSISGQRMKRHLMLVAVALSWFVPSAPAAMVVEGYNPANHDRFYVGSDKAFIGDPYNWSGVATNGSASWATLVTSDYFLSSTHAHPAIGSTLTFYDGNNPSGPYETATVASGQEIDLQLGSSDVWLGKLTAPVSSNITVYPVYAPPVPSNAVGNIVYTYGLSNSSTASQNQRLGRNVISYLGLGVTNCTFTYKYDNPGLGADESLGISGDSGAPAFVIVNGVPALAGTVFQGDQATYTSDSFISQYVSQIDAAMVGEQLTTIVPEPGTLGMLALGALGLLAWRGWRKRK